MSDEKLCIQDRIRRKYNEIHPLYRYFTIVILVIIISYYIFYTSYEETIFMNFLTEFTAGVLGVLLGFFMGMFVDLAKGRRISSQILNSILVELNSNLELLNKIIPQIGITPFHVTVDFFILFQTSAWDTFSARLETDNITLLFELGNIYHKFKLFNEGMKLQSLGGELSDLLKRNPKFLEELETKLKIVISMLES